jgi:glycosyltransferase involved in cell wall biosynthesis
MLTNSHKPLDPRVFQKEGRTLAKAGYEVNFVTPFGEDFHQEGVNILAVPEAKGGWQKLVTCPWNLFKKALRFPSDAIIQIHDSELLVIAIMLKIAGRRVVYDAHEDTPLQISYLHWVPKVLKKPYTWLYLLLEKIAGHFFDAIIVAEPVIAKYFPPHKTYLVRNFPIVTAFKQFPSLPYQQRELILVYVGLLSRARGLMEMLKGADLAHQRTTFEFYLGGKFSPPSLESEVIGKYPVHFLSWLEFDQIAPLLHKSRVGIIVPNPNERYKTNYPVKLFEYWSAALPVIASGEGESAAFVKESNSGILVDPLNEKEIGDAVTWLMDHPEEAEAMGKRGQDMIFTKYNWENEQKRLIDVFDRISGFDRNSVKDFPA